MTPGMFYGLTGQQGVKDKLSGLIRRGTPGHAHLFTGPEGMGKRSFAKAFAKALLCIGGDDGTARQGGGENARQGGGLLPCGKCLPCRLMNTGALDDYFTVEPSGQGQKPVIPVDAIRGITDWMVIRPLYSRRKTCIIAQADRMTEQAQNALLKTLEEPPDYGIIILTASNPENLLETVRSRCVVTRFSAYSGEEMRHILENSGEVAAGADIGLYTRISGLNPGYAIELAGSGAFLSERDELLGLFCEFLNGRPDSFFLLSSFLIKNKDSFRQYAGVLIRWLHDIWRSSLDGAYEAANGDMARRIDAFYGRFPQEGLLDCICDIDEACEAVTYNANFSLAVNVTLFRIINLLCIK